MTTKDLAHTAPAFPCLVWLEYKVTAPATPLLTILYFGLVFDGIDRNLSAVRGLNEMTLADVLGVEGPDFIIPSRRLGGNSRQNPQDAHDWDDRHNSTIPQDKHLEILSFVWLC